MSTTRYPVPGTNWSPVATSAVYNEAATVGTCVNPATCNKPATTTDSLGNPTTYTYLSSGQIQRVVGPAVTAQTGGTAGSAQTDLCYTATAASSGTVSLLTGSIQKVTASVNRVKSLGYDTAANHLNLLSVTADPATTWVPPATAGGACTTTSKSTPLALLAHIAYDSHGNVASITNPRSYQTTFNFDAMRRLTTISAPLGALTRYCYTADGLFASSNSARTATTDPNASTATTTGLCPTAYPAGTWLSEARNYFSNGELQNVTDANGNITVYAYDADGRQQVVQDGDGRQTATIYDAAGQVLYTWRGGSGWINSSGLPSGSWPNTWVPSSYTGTGNFRYAAYTYTLNGKPLSVTDAGGTTTNYHYDGFDRLTSTIYADTTHEDQWYTIDGTTATARCSAGDQPCRKITRAGNYIDYGYDAADRKVTRTPQLEGGYTYGYTLSGEPSATDKLALGSTPGHSTLIGYDAAGRESSETNDGRQVSYLLDGADNRTQLTWPDGYQVTYQYDALNRMTYALENGTTELAYYDYDTLSRRNYVCLGGQSSSCIAGGGTNKTSYTYNLRFPGQYYLAESGLFCNGRRTYDPQMGRYLESDRIGLAGGVNTYTYVGNDPMDRSDPSGEDFVAPSWSTIGYALEAVGAEILGGGPEDPAGDAAAAYAGRQAALSYGRDIAAAALQKPDGVEGRLKPVEGAEGPHSTYKRGPDGTINKTAEYKPNPRNPSGHDEVKRTDTTGKSHFNKTTKQDVPTPHTHDPTVPGGVRPATPGEIPKPAPPPPPPPPKDPFLP